MRSQASNEEKTLKPSTSNAQLKGRLHILKNLSKNEENDDYEDFFNKSQREQSAYNTETRSHRSYKSMTSRKFPKVTLSAAQQAKILSKIPKYAHMRGGKDSIESKSRLLATNSRIAQGV